MDSKWLIRVYRDLRAGSDDVEVGTAYPIVDRLVLVARHVVAEHPNDKLWLDIDARKITLTWVNCPLEGGKPFAIVPPSTEAEACQIDVKWDGREWGLDAAVLQCAFPPGLKIEKQRLDGEEPKAGEAWSSCGFAQAGPRHERRKPQALQGKTEKYINGNTSYHLGVDYPVINPRDWRGLSGAPVFVNGKIQGLITDNAPPYGGGRIEAVPIFLLLKIQKFRDLLGPQHDPVSIDPTRFRKKIAEILQKAPAVLQRLEETASGNEFHGKAISVRCGHESFDRRSMHIVDNMFADLDTGGRLLRLALHESLASGDAAIGDNLVKIACLFFPACFMRDKSELFFEEYRQNEQTLIDARATSIAWIELRMAAIEGRAADFDPDQTRPDGPVGRMKIHDPPPFALEAMRKDEFREAFAKLLYEKTFSSVGRRIKRYSARREAINAELEIGKNPEGAPYLVLGDPDAQLTDAEKAEMAAIAGELRGQYSNLMVTCVSDDDDLIDLELKYLDWLWKTLKAK